MKLNKKETKKKKEIMTTELKEERNIVINHIYELKPPQCANSSIMAGDSTAKRKLDISVAQALFRNALVRTMLQKILISCSQRTSTLPNLLLYYSFCNFLIFLFSLAFCFSPVTDCFNREPFSTFNIYRFETQNIHFNLQ